jgi:hypothetical protein
MSADDAIAVGAAIWGVVVVARRRFFAQILDDQKRRHPYLTTWPFTGKASERAMACLGLIITVSAVATVLFGA